MNVKAVMLAIVVALFSTFAVANETANDNAIHAGIEIVVNVNQAPAQEIADLLKGIGLKKAQAIVEYREQQGPFQSAEDLAKVKGIGEATVAKNLARIEL
ncbi:ComEA family DNA-binding protein [Vibrio taketomensis]|uniref:ComEA family DNA-binding protein n=1 Tax=Vibrio taketomensis TaxID=2572923 RepID=UPI00138A2091|nr:helix-hairpin-helix domain-containing protein [Vibrio taketomensis]